MRRREKKRPWSFDIILSFNPNTWESILMKVKQYTQYHFVLFCCCCCLCCRLWTTYHEVMNLRSQKKKKKKKIHFNSFTNQFHNNSAQTKRFAQSQAVGFFSVALVSITHCCLQTWLCGQFELVALWPLHKFTFVVWSAFFSLSLVVIMSSCCFHTLGVHDVCVFTVATNSIYSTNNNNSRITIPVNLGYRVHLLCVPSANPVFPLLSHHTAQAGEHCRFN